MTASPLPQEPRAVTDAQVDALIDKARTSPFIEGVRKRVEASVALARRWRQPSPEHIQDEAYLLMTIDDLAAALAALAQERSAAREREASARDIMEQGVRPEFWTRDCPDVSCGYCGGEFSWDDGHFKHALNCMFFRMERWLKHEPIRQALDGPGSSSAGAGERTS